MVSIFTYRDERKLFALIATIIVVAIVALVQIETTRSGKSSPITSALASVSTYLEYAVSFVANGTRNVVGGIASAPKYAGENAALRAKVDRLERANARMTEQISRYPDEAALDRLKTTRPDGIDATVVGFDPEDAVRVVTIDRGTLANVRNDDGVVSASGASAA